MKILFYSLDESVHNLVSDVNHQNMVVTDDSDQIIELSEAEQSLIFIDFDEDKKSAEKLNKALMDGDGIRIIMTESIKLKDLKKHQKGKTAAEGYVRKPLTLKIINEILNDFELAEHVAEVEAFEEGDDLGDVQQTALSETHGTVYDEDGDDVEEMDFASNVMKVDDRVKEQLDAHSVSGEDGPNFATPVNVDIQAKFDMVFDRPYMGESEAEAEVDIPGPGADPGAGMETAPAAEGGFDLDMGDDEEGVDTDLDINVEEPEDVDIDLNLGGDEDEGELDISLGAEEEGEVDLDEDTTPEGSLDLSADEPEEAPADEDIDLTIDTNISDVAESELSAPVDLDTEEEEPPVDDLDLNVGDELQEEEAQLASEEEAVKKDDDLGLELGEDDGDLEEGALEFGGGDDAASEVEVEDENVEGLDFASSDDEDPLEMGSDKEDDDGGLDLGGGDDDGGLDLGGGDDDGGLDLGGGDDDGGLDLGGGDDDGGLDLGGGDDDGGLDLGGGDDDGGLDLGGGDDAVAEVEEDTGALDLSAEEPEEPIEEDDDEVSATLEGIVAEADDSDEGELNISAAPEENDLEEDDLDLGGDEEIDLAVTDDVDLSQELDLSEEGEDASEVLDFSGDEGTGEIDQPTATDTDANIDDEDFSDDFNEETNPTVVMDSEDNSLKEFKAPVPGSETEDLDEEELDLGAEEDEDELDLSAVEDEELDDEEMDLGAEEIEDDAEEIAHADPDMTVTEFMQASDVAEEAEEVVEADEEELAPAPVQEEPAPAPVEDTPITITPEEQRVAEAFNQTELARLQGTIRQLREEREELLKEIHELKTEGKLGEQERLGMQAELDEAKIEIQILKKRNHEEVDELKYQLRLSDEKKQIYEERAKNVQKEFDRLNQKVRIDINQVKQREKELESQLELVTMDSQSQVKSRDMKILELKRKIDALEFNMENASIRELKSREDKERVEERLEKIMRTLRGSLKSLESDADTDDGILDKIDKL